MVKLVRVERACEQTGNDNCPLHSSQIERVSKLRTATHVQVVTDNIPTRWHAGIAPLDPHYKPKVLKFKVNKTW